jgi:peroxiredoxin (alkyl hydroperoxide reductase subunit C)
MEGRFPLLGDAFPEMKVQTTHGKVSLPGDYKGSWFVLFSHPADFTPVCTTEFVAFQKRHEQFKALGCKLIGMSIDQVFSHIKWVEWIQEKLGVDIEFPIIAGTESVAAQLGLVHPGKGANTVRAVFIVDPKGALRAMLYYPQELGRNMDEIVRMVKGLKLGDKEGVAIPAGWPNNELVKDHVIVPPATDVEGAKKRQKEYECFDWWFCHKPA